MKFECVTYGQAGAIPTNILALDDVLELHQKRFVARTRNDQVFVLRYLRWCDFVRCSNRINNDPVANSMREELTCLQSLPKDRLDEGMMKRQSELGALMQPYTEPFLWACIEAPHIESPEAMNALYMSMDADERLKLDEMLAALTMQIPNAKLDIELASISERFNIPIISPSELVKLTLQQVRLLCPREEGP